MAWKRVKANANIWVVGRRYKVIGISEYHAYSIGDIVELLNIDKDDPRLKFKVQSVDSGLIQWVCHDDIKEII